MSILEGIFGDETFERYADIMTEIDSDTFSRVMERSWKSDEFNTTKENYSATKLVHFLPDFNIAMLIRKLLHTFPTSRPDYIVPILNSFLISGPYRTVPLANELNELRRYLLHFPVRSYHEAGILAYVVHHYILADGAFRHKLPVIQYDDLVTKNGTELENAVQCLETFGIEIPRLSAEITRKRSENFTTLGAREAKFFSLCDDRFTKNLEKIRDFILELSPHLLPTFERYTGLDKAYRR